MVGFVVRIRLQRPVPSVRGIQLSIDLKVGDRKNDRWVVNEIEKGRVAPVDIEVMGITDRWSRWCDQSINAATRGGLASCIIPCFEELFLKSSRFQIQLCFVNRKSRSLHRKHDYLESLRGRLFPYIEDLEQVCKGRYGGLSGSCECGHGTAAPRLVVDVELEGIH